MTAQERSLQAHRRNPEERIRESSDVIRFGESAASRQPKSCTPAQESIHLSEHAGWTGTFARAFSQSVTEFLTGLFGLSLQVL